MSWESISVAAVSLAALASAFSAYFAFQSGKQLQRRVGVAEDDAVLQGMQGRHLDDQRKTFRARMLLRISEEWNRILPIRYSLLDRLKQDRVDDRVDIEKRYGSWSQFLNTDDWKEIREVLNFFEFLGILIEKEYVNEDEAFVLVSVDHFQRPEGTGIRVPPEQGDFYSLVKPYIDFLRHSYRSDIYYYYDRVALPRYHARVVRVDKEI